MAEELLPSKAFRSQCVVVKEPVLAAGIRQQLGHNPNEIVRRNCACEWRQLELSGPVVRFREKSPPSWQKGETGSALQVHLSAISIDPKACIVRPINH